MRLFDYVLYTGDMAACGASDRAIQIAIVDHHLSERLRNALLIGKDFFYNILISDVNLRRYNN